MINLLPNDKKKQIRAARANTRLISYIVFLLFTIAFLSITCFVVYTLLNNVKISAEQVIKDNQSTAGSYDSVMAQSKIIESNLFSADDALDQTVSYSDIIMEIAAIIPATSIIDTFSVKDAINAPILIKIYSKSADDANLIRDNILNSKILVNPSIQTENNQSNNPSKYPFVNNISMTINPGILQ